MKSLMTPFEYVIDLFPPETRPYFRPEKAPEPRLTKKQILEKEKKKKKRQISKQSRKRNR